MHLERQVIDIFSFACKGIKKEELVKCSFRLNKTEFNLLMFLLGEKRDLTVSEAARKMGLKRTTIQKAIKTLLERKLAKRFQYNLPRGSYVFRYKVKNKQEIKEEMKQTVREWAQAVETEIERL